MFSWDTQKAITNYEKHGIPFEEAVTVFSDSEGLNWKDLTHSEKEERFKRIGKSVQKNILMVVYTVRKIKHGKQEKETIRIISARQASRKERKAYAR